ncbi:hypothetical protein DFH09DRAFT_1424098 [Mycena vulgaris]|nr:hypothetical protein DFH09DRAFT_1424098 [Mycena vulgaris]
MQPHFPQELLDHIIDLLHENPVVLQACALQYRSAALGQNQSFCSGYALGTIKWHVTGLPASHSAQPPPRDPHPPHLPLHQSSHLQFALHAFGDSRVLSSLGSTEACLWTKLSAALPAVGMLDLRSVTTTRRSISPPSRVLRPPTLDTLAPSNRIRMVVFAGTFSGMSPDLARRDRCQRIRADCARSGAPRPHKHALRLITSITLRSGLR